MIEKQEDSTWSTKGGKAILKNQCISIINLKKAAAILFDRENLEWFAVQHRVENGVEMLWVHCNSRLHAIRSNRNIANQFHLL